MNYSPILLYVLLGNQILFYDSFLNIKNRDTFSASGNLVFQEYICGSRLDSETERTARDQTGR